MLSPFVKVLTSNVGMSVTNVSAGVAALLAVTLVGAGCGARQAQGSAPPRGVRTIGTIAAQRITLALRKLGIPMSYFHI